jgi:hypothetical protein
VSWFFSGEHRWRVARRTNFIFPGYSIDATYHNGWWFVVKICFAANHTFVWLGAKCHGLLHQPIKEFTSRSAICGD